MALVVPVSERLISPPMPRNSTRLSTFGVTGNRMNSPTFAPRTSGNSATSPPRHSSGSVSVRNGSSSSRPPGTKPNFFDLFVLCQINLSG